MAVSDYSTTPGNNTSIAGINIGEGCPSANINNAIRQLMADVATFAAAQTGGASYMPISGAPFTGNPTFTGKGGYIYNGASTSPGGMRTVLPSGAQLPASGTDGDEVLFYG